MAANTASLEEIAVTLPTSIIVLNMVRIVVPIHGNGKGMEVNPLSFLCIPPGFFPLSNHPIIHFN
jgi:hypothetical protein